jgi:peroxiredoxin
MSKFRSVILATIPAVAAALLIFAVLGRPVLAPQVAFVSLTGEKITTASLRGKVVLVNFWATDCVICIKEMPEMARTYERYRERGLEFVAVAMKHDPPNYVIAYAEKNRLPFRVALDPLGELAQAFGDIRFTPTTLIIDKRGRIVSRIQGEPDFARLHKLLEEKLDAPA